MILTFKKQFVDKILEGSKIHTIRADNHNRWQVGNKIHFWCGNPRNTKSNPYQFAEGVCSSVDYIEIYPNINKIILNQEPIHSISFLNRMASYDGFDNWEDMKQWFKEDFKGKLIFWNLNKINHK